MRVRCTPEALGRISAGTRSACRARAPKGQKVKTRGETPGTTRHNVLCALKGHTEQGGCGHRLPRWGDVSWGGVTQGSAPLHPGLSPCAALRRGHPAIRQGCTLEGRVTPRGGCDQSRRVRAPGLQSGTSGICLSKPFRVGGVEACVAVSDMVGMPQPQGSRAGDGIGVRPGSNRRVSSCRFEAGFQVPVLCAFEVRRRRWSG